MRVRCTFARCSIEMHLSFLCVLHLCFLQLCAVSTAIETLLRGLLGPVCRLVAPRLSLQLQGLHGGVLFLVSTVLATWSPSRRELRYLHRIMCSNVFTPSSFCLRVGLIVESAVRLCRRARGCIRRYRSPSAEPPIDLTTQGVEPHPGPSNGARAACDGCEEDASSACQFLAVRAHSTNNRSAACRAA